MAGRIRADDLEQLRERVDLVEVISGYTQLKKAGRIFKGLCCFHQEKTPSLTVDPDKRLYVCFGCGAGGDVFTFLRQIEGLSFTEAAERLASRVGISLRHEGGDGRSDRSSRHLLLTATVAAAEFFADVLMRSPEAENARKYLENRGFTSDDARTWKLGYAPSGHDVLYRNLLGRKFDSRQIVDAGLATVNDRGEHRDRFRGRLIFPIADISGDIVGFGARALQGESPKYLNSPETAIYHKGKVLYGLERARQHMSSLGEAVVVEGYTDVMALQKAGAENAVATCGTALGEDHLAVIKRFCDRVILAFDADAAGAVATRRAFGIHAQLGLEVLVAPMPAGKDPADVALAGGPEAVRPLLEQAKPLMRFVLESEISRHRLETAEGKANAVRAAAGLLAWEPRRVARGEHAFWVARRIGVGEADVQREIAEVGQEPVGAQAGTRNARLPGHVKVERETLSFLLQAPDRLGGVMEWIGDEHFTQPEHRTLLRAMIDGGGAGARNILDRLSEDGTRRLAAELALTPRLTQDEEELFRRLREFRLRRQIESIRNKLEQLSPNSGEYQHLFRELMRLEEERRGNESV
jgi:DNA primase